MAYVGTTTVSANNDGNPTAGVSVMQPPAQPAQGDVMKGTTIEGLKSLVGGTLGTKIELTPAFGSTQVYETTGHSSTGIPYALQGSATQVSHDIGCHLAVRAV